MSHKIVRDRAARIDFTKELHKQNPDWSEERVVAEVSLETGVTKYTASKYVDLLRETGRW